MIGENESGDTDYEREILHQRNQDLLATLFGSSAVIVGKENSKGNLPTSDRCCSKWKLFI